MKLSSLLLMLLLVSVMISFSWAQVDQSAQQSSSGTQAGSTQAPGAGARAAGRAQRHEQMQAMCKEHMEAMKSDVQKLHSSFDQMKANVAKIINADEKARWQANLDMWQTVVNHHDQMLKHMEDAQANGMGCGMMMGEMGMGGGMMHPHGAGAMDTPPKEPAAT